MPQRDQPPPRHQHPSRVLAALALTAAFACAPADEPAAEPALPALYPVAEAEQVGPVAYRDPLGAVSPDGRWLAYTERDRVVVIPVEGGAARVLGPGTSTIRFLTWLPDSRHVAVQERVFDRSRQRWWRYDRVDGSRERLWPDEAVATESEDTPSPAELGQLAWSADGSRIAGVRRGSSGSSVWILDPDGRAQRQAASGAGRSYPAWTPDGTLACLAFTGERQHLHLPCDSAEGLFDDQETYGPVAFSPDGSRVYYGAPDADGFLDLWSRPVQGGEPRRLTRFARDAYAPSVAPDGSVVFKSQDYRTFLATAPADGGLSTPLTAFQSETPSWSPDGSRVAFTFGSWRHVTDDIHYPDIAQHLGTVPSDASTPFREPDRVVRSSHSEDQSLTWSPNGHWIAFHTHVDSDDIWLMPADGSGEARMISESGSETGWPRWSPDGRWIVFASYRDTDEGGRRAHLFLIGVDQETGEVTQPQTRIEMPGFEADIIHGEWLDQGETLVFEAAAAIGDKSLWTVLRTGGASNRIHGYDSDQVHSGIGASPDGRAVAYVDRAADGTFQIFRVPVSGGAPRQLTFDPTHKTQPSYDPRGERLAFTVFDYAVRFWRIDP